MLSFALKIALESGITINESAGMINALKKEGKSNKEIKEKLKTLVETQKVRGY